MDSLSIVNLFFFFLSAVVLQITMKPENAFLTGVQEEDKELKGVWARPRACVSREKVHISRT